MICTNQSCSNYQKDSGAVPFCPQCGSRMSAPAVNALLFPIIYSIAGSRRALMLTVGKSIRVGSAQFCEVQVEGPGVAELEASLNFSSDRKVVLSVPGHADQSHPLPLTLDIQGFELTFYRPQDSDLFEEGKAESNLVSFAVSGHKQQSEKFTFAHNVPFLIGSDAGCNLRLDEVPLCPPIAIALWARGQSQVLVQVLDSSAAIDWPGRQSEQDAVLSFPIYLSVAGKLLILEWQLEGATQRRESPVNRPPSLADRPFDLQANTQSISSAMSKQNETLGLNQQRKSDLFFNFINPFLEFIDSGRFFRQPFSWLYGVIAVLNFLLPLVSIYYAFKSDIFDAPAKLVFVFLLLWLVLAFVSWTSFQLWWQRRRQLEELFIQGDEFVATPVYAHFIQTVGEWIGIWVAIVGFFAMLLLNIGFDNMLNQLGFSLGKGGLITIILTLVLPFILGFMIIITARFMAEQFRALASIANNTKKR